MNNIINSPKNGLIYIIQSSRIFIQCGHLGYGTPAVPLLQYRFNSIVSAVRSMASAVPVCSAALSIQSSMYIYIL